MSADSNGKLAPGRYCLAVCYCGQCPHYVPVRRTWRETRALADQLATGKRNGNIRYHRKGDGHAR